MERRFNAGQSIAAYTHLSSTFTSYSEIFVGNCNFFLPLAFNSPVGVVSTGIPGKGLVTLVLRKLESWGYQAVKTVC